MWETFLHLLFMPTSQPCARLLRREHSQIKYLDKKQTYIPNSKFLKYGNHNLSHGSNMDQIWILVMREITIKLEISNFSRLTFHWHLLSFAMVPLVHKQKELDKFCKTVLC